MGVRYREHVVSGWCSVDAEEVWMMWMEFIALMEILNAEINCSPISFQHRLLKHAF